MLFLAILPAAIACQAMPNDRQPDDPPAGAERPAPIDDPAPQPSAQRFLPPLSGYRTDDAAETGDLMSSLDHGEVPYAEIRRRLVLDDAGFTRGDVTVVTFEPGTDAAEQYLRHRFGNADRSPVRINGVDMVRIHADPHALIAWVDPGFVVTFQRGASEDDAWLEELARQTVDGVAAASAAGQGSAQ